jgi:arylsulfatase A-like enzyme
MGVRVPLVVRWGENLKKNSRVKDFVSLIDLAPTFLEFAGVDVPEQMTGKSLKPILLSDDKGNAEANRDYIVFGRERHTPAQLAPSMDGYPSRGIHTHEYLYIRNLFPDRWPAGVAAGATHPIGSFADCDDGITKTFLIENADNPQYKQYYDLSFGKRPGEELYDIKNDPYQLTNLANNTEFLSIKNNLSDRLTEILTLTGDPRLMPGGVDFDSFPYRAPYELVSRK